MCYLSPDCCVASHSLSGILLPWRAGHKPHSLPGLIISFPVKKPNRRASKKAGSPRTGACSKFGMRSDTWDKE